MILLFSYFFIKYIIIKKKEIWILVNINWAQFIMQKFFEE